MTAKSGTNPANGGQVWLRVEGTTSTASPRPAASCSISSPTHGRSFSSRWAIPRSSALSLIGWRSATIYCSVGKIANCQIGVELVGDWAFLAIPTLLRGRCAPLSRWIGCSHNDTIAPGRASRASRVTSALAAGCRTRPADAMRTEKARRLNYATRQPYFAARPRRAAPTESRAMTTESKCPLITPSAAEPRTVTGGRTSSARPLTSIPQVQSMGEDFNYAKEFKSSTSPR